ncbi:MAG: HNH endonuclease [Deltaproteobacteria bacterium]|nr:HNH endonuclease [Deltaproteobacteria bacterium]
MAKALGYPTFASANLHYGRLGRAVGTALGWDPLPTTLVYVLAEFEKPEREWFWIMRPAVAGALEQLCLVEGEHSAIPEEVDVTVPLYEGAVRRIAVNAYERSSAAREQCILHYGCRCAACGLTLAEKYGECVQGLIHVHHLRQLAEVNAKYQVDPVQDLRPVCPTCHAVIHSRPQPFTVEEVRIMIEEAEKNANQASEVTARKLAEPKR